MDAERKPVSVASATQAKENFDLRMDIWCEWENNPGTDDVLGEKFSNRLSLHQFTRLVQVVVNDGFWFDTERVVDGGK